jgi:hypothetical protein
MMAILITDNRWYDFYLYKDKVIWMKHERGRMYKPFLLPPEKQLVEESKENHFFAVIENLWIARLAELPKDVSWYLSGKEK